MKPTAPNVAAVMTPAPVTLAPDAPVSLAMRVMMRRSFRHLPVVDGALLVGVVSERDLLAARDGQRVVRDVMATDCVVTRPDAPAAVAAQTLLTMKIGCLPVLEDGALVGIVTETDFVRVAYAVLSAVSASVDARPRRRGKRAPRRQQPRKRARLAK